MKAILVQVPCWCVQTPPYNLALLKAVSQQRGHEVCCYDFNIKFYNYLNKEEACIIYGNPTNWYNDEYVAEIIKDYPDFVNSCVQEIENQPVRVIGFTVTGLSKMFALEIARRLKQKNKEYIIVFGGPACFRNEFGDAILRENFFIDAVCYLEGENIFPKMLDGIEKENKMPLLPGFAFRGAENKIIDSFGVDEAFDLNELPFADYSDFNLAGYIVRELPISVSRGCINRCKFCSEAAIWGRYRYRSAINIYKEIRYQLNRYPQTKYFYFSSSLINGNLAVLNELSDLLIKNGIKIEWGGQGFIREGMNRALINKMHSSGFTHVSYGLESASPRILKKMGKSFSPELAEKVIRETKEAGVRTDVNIIIGFPGEEEIDVLETADFLKRNRKFIDEIYFHPLAVAKGSYLYSHSKELGIQFDNNFNPNTWNSECGVNTLDKRLETLEFYRACLNRDGESFFCMADYYLLIADGKIKENDYQGALVYLLKAQQLNKDKSKRGFIGERINFVFKKVHDNNLKV